MVFAETAVGLEMIAGGGVTGMLDDGDLQRLETLSVETRAAERLCVSGTPRPNAPPGTGPTR
jgi:hypothetical protein